jgi:hypothetical protein
MPNPENLEGLRAPLGNTLPEDRMNKKPWTDVALWVVAAFLMYVFARQGVAKFSDSSGWAKAFAMWHYPVWFRIVIGVLETVAAGLLLTRRTAPLSLNPRDAVNHFRPPHEIRRRECLKPPSNTVLEPARFRETGQTICKARSRLEPHQIFRMPHMLESRGPGARFREAGLDAESLHLRGSVHSIRRRVLRPRRRTRSHEFLFPHLLRHGIGRVSPRSRSPASHRVSAPAELHASRGPDPSG